MRNIVFRLFNFCLLLFVMCWMFDLHVFSVPHLCSALRGLQRACDPLDLGGVEKGCQLGIEP